jgi:paraquat-inducible protein B
MQDEIPVVRESTKFTFITSIWIVPIIALLIALWLAYQYFTTLGPMIEITFKSNGGLQAGQSVIKLRDVPVGKVEKVLLDDSGAGVKVLARMEREAIPYLNSNAIFWIVKPEVSAGGISGLDTLLTGSYINMVGKKGKMNKKKFIGLEHPYRLMEKGEYFHLNALSSFGIVVGTPVYFKNMKAGLVEYVTISLDEKSVDIIVYIDKAFVPYIHADTKFWKQSIVDIEYANGQFNFNVAPLSNILRGGIEFSSSGEDASKMVPDDYIFRLYRDSGAASDKRLGKGGKALKDFLMEFEESTAKLKHDASVKYEQFEVGRVKDIEYNYDRETHRLKARVTASIDTSIFYDASDTNRSGEKNLEEAVAKGLRASLQEHDPISGLLYINLSFVEDNRSRRIAYLERGALFPTVSRRGGGLMGGLNGLIDKLKELPLDQLIVSISDAAESLSDTMRSNEASLEKIMQNLNKTLEGINAMVGSSAFAALPKELNKTFRELRKTLRSLDAVIKADSDKSLLSSQLTDTLRQLNKASIDTQKLLRKLDRKPNSLIFGD